MVENREQKNDNDIIQLHTFRKPCPRSRSMSWSCFSGGGRDRLMRVNGDAKSPESTSPSPTSGGSSGANELVRVPVNCPSDIMPLRSEEHTSELQSLMRISYAVFCLKKKTNIRL